jgi:hypothetical protein
MISRSVAASMHTCETIAGAPAGFSVTMRIYQYPGLRGGSSSSG